MTVTGPYEDILRYTGTSVDTKPTTGVDVGSELYETDTELNYIYTGSAWVVGKADVDI